MHEEVKIGEAEYFLDAIEKATTPIAFRYEVSAFLTAARSVLQYVRAEAIRKQGGKAWFDAAVACDPIVAFLKESRDINIHERPVPMLTHYALHAEPGAFAVSSSGVLPPALPDGALPSTWQSQFKGWPGPEDVPTVCARYLQQIKRIVSDGRAKAFLGH